MGALGAGGDEAGILLQELAEGFYAAGDDGIGGGFEAGRRGALTLEGPDVAGESGPALEAVGAGDEEPAAAILAGSLD